MNDLNYTSQDLKPKGLEEIPSTKMEQKMNEEVLSVPEQPGVSFGIEQTQDVVEFGVSLANAIVKSLKDGKLGLADIPSFISPVTKLPAAISGIGQVPSEISDIQEEELAALIEYVKANLEVDDEKAKEIIQLSIKLIYDAYNLVKVI